MNYVIIGTGATGIMAAKEIRKLKKDAQITMISADEQVHSRCMLHKYLSHERTAEELSFVEKTLRKIRSRKYTDILKLSIQQSDG